MDSQIPYAVQVHHGGGIEASDSHLQGGFVFHQFRQAGADGLIFFPVFIGIVYLSDVERIALPLHNIVKF